MSDNVVLAFDIETIPDARLLKLHYDEPEAEDEQIIERARQEALEKSDGRSDFLRLIFHRIVAISYVHYGRDELCIKSLAHPQLNEKEALHEFFCLIEQQSPLLVSWNGSAFDLPVLVLRALHHGVSARGFWNGPGDKWRQYSSRYHDAHQDIMDMLAFRQPRAAAKLADVALACGLPGKMGYGGDQVYPLFVEQRYAEISNYCETDALNTFLIWLRFARSSGKFSAESYQLCTGLIKDYLSQSGAKHLQTFLKNWQH